MRNEIVLVIAQIGDDSLASTVLIKVDGGVQCVSVAEFLFFSFSFVYFVFVEYWIFFLEQMLELITKQVSHTSRIET